MDLANCDLVGQSSHPWHPMTGLIVLSHHCIFVFLLMTNIGAAGVPPSRRLASQKGFKILNGVKPLEF